MDKSPEMPPDAHSARAALLKWRKRNLILAALGLCAVFAMLCLAVSWLPDAYTQSRIKDRFEFKVDDPNSEMTEQQALELGKQALHKLGIEVGTVEPTEPAGQSPTTMPINKYFFQRQPDNPNSENIAFYIFNSPKFDYEEYIVDFEKKGETVSAVVVLGE